MLWQASPAIANVTLSPQLADTLPLGVMEPPLPAEATIVYGSPWKLAAIVWSVVTPVKV